MKKILVWCLFFLCAFGCVGCMKMGLADDNQAEEHTLEEEKRIETIGNNTTDEMPYVVVTDGNEILTKTAEFICKKAGAVHISLSGKMEEERNRIEQAECILIGTDKNLLEFEFSLRSGLEEELLKGKKVSLFLVDREEEIEQFEEKIKEWYPDILLLPTFTMVSDREVFEEELGRINGWLTTVMTYGM